MRNASASVMFTSRAQPAISTMLGNGWTCSFAAIIAAGTPARVSTDDDAREQERTARRVLPSALAAGGPVTVDAARIADAPGHLEDRVVSLPNFVGGGYTAFGEQL